MPLRDDIRVSFPSDPEYMTAVRALVEKVSELIGFDDSQTGQIVLAVDEACSNIIRHQYEGRTDGRIDLAVRPDGETGIEFVLRDYGPVRDPSTFRGRRLEDVRPGGLGLHIISEVMDGMHYAPADGGGMRLELRKEIPKEVK